MKTRRIPIARGRSTSEIERTRATIVNAPALDDPGFWKRFGPKGECVENPYKEMPWVFASVTTVSRLVSSIPLRIYQGRRPTYRASTANPVAWMRERVRAINETGAEDRKPVPESHELVRLFDRPSPVLSRTMFWRAVVTYQALTGECFVVMLDELGRAREEKRIPRELWPFSGQGWQPFQADGSDGIDARTRVPYGWKRGNVRYRAPAITHFRTFDPDNLYRGMSPLQAARTDMEADHAAASFNRNFFRAGCNPGGIFKHPKSLTPAQRKEFKDIVREENEGTDNAWSSLLLENGVEFQWNPRTQKDAEFQELRRSARDAELVVLGVQKASLSITDDLNYATALGQRRLLLENTVVPMLADIEDVLWTYLFSNIEGGRYWAEYDVSTVQALQDDVTAKAGSAKTLFELGWSRDTINARLGLGFEPDDSTDVTITDIQSGGIGIEPEEEPAADPQTTAAPAPPQPGVSNQAAAATLASGGSVQDTALNGAQIQSLVDLASKVQAKELAPETAISIITVAYPTIDLAEATAIINPAAAAAKQTPAPEPSSSSPQHEPGNGIGPATPPGAQAPPNDDEDEDEPRMGALLALAEMFDRREDAGTESWHREWMQRVASKATSVFRAVMKKYLGRLRKDQLGAFEKYVSGLAKDGLTVADIDNILFAKKTWDRELQKAASQPMKTIQRLAGKGLAKEIKVSVVAVNTPRMVEIHARKIASLVRVNAVTRKILRSQLIEGVSKSETISQIRDRLKGTLEHLGGPDRALRIARTEVGFMTQATRMEGMRENGVGKKKWLSVLGEGTRETHRADHGKTLKLDERFPNSGLLHPLEIGGPVEEVVNCDCTLLPIVEGF